MHETQNYGSEQSPRLIEHDLPSSQRAAEQLQELLLDHWWGGSNVRGQTGASTRSCAHRSAQTMHARHWLSIVGVAFVAASPVAAQSVIDGDSIDLGGTTYRLHGIDAPDSGQICADGWPAGYAAEEYLDKLIEGKQITCMPMIGKAKSETVAICRADGVDLGAAMVTGGYAYAFVPYSARYIPQEAAAASARRGVHAHKCLVPWKWRARLTRGR